MKKALLCIVLLLAAVFVIAACNRGAADPAPATPTPATPTPAPGPATPAPPTPEPVPEGPIFPARVSIYGNLPGQAIRAGAETPNDIAAWQIISELTGTEIDWVLIPQNADWDLEFNLLLAGGDLPDILRQGWPSVPGGPHAFYEDGVIICLRDIVDNYMPNFRQIMDERQGWAAITFNEDNIFFIPEVRDSINLAVWLGPQIRGDWLDALDLPMPETIDELHQTLIAFRDAEPDGQPVWGMSGMRQGTAHCILQMFFAWGFHWRWYQIDGEVRPGVLSPYFEEAVTFLNMLYNDGLLDPDYAIQDRAMLDGKFLSGQIGFMFAPQPTILMQNATTEGFRVDGVPWLRREAGSPRFVISPEYTPTAYIAAGNSAAISSQAQNPGQVATFLDFIFTYEGSVATGWGREGEDWVWEDGRRVFVDAFWALEPDYRHLRTFGATSQIPFLRLWDVFQLGMHDRGSAAVDVWAPSGDPVHALPSFPRTTEQTERYNAVMGDIVTHLEESISRFIVGTLPLDQIPAFQESVRDMGIYQARDAQQEAFDLFLSRMR